MWAELAMAALTTVRDAGVPQGQSGSVTWAPLVLRQLKPWLWVPQLECLPWGPGAQHSPSPGTVGAADQHTLVLKVSWESPCSSGI